MCVNQRFLSRKLPNATDQIPLVRSYGNEAVCVALSQYFTSLQLPALLAPGTGSPLLRETAHPASVAAGVPAAQLGRAEEIVSRELWVCVEKRLFGDSQAVSTHTTTPTKPGFQRLVFNSAQGGAERNLIAP